MSPRVLDAATHDMRAPALHERHERRQPQNKTAHFVLPDVLCSARYGKMPPKEVNPFGNPKPFLRAAAAGGAKDAVQPPAASDDSAAAPQKSKKQMHRKDKVVFWVVH